MGDVIINLDDVSFVRDSRVILEGINLDVRENDFVTITGPNGGGKTTLLRLILGLLIPTTGKITVSPDLSIGYLPQKNTIDSKFPVTVKEVVESGLLKSKLSKAEKEDKIEEVLSSVGMVGRSKSAIGRLSGGQLQRTLLARAIISDPSLIVLDEPLSYIDKQFEPKLYEIISDISKKASILLVSHELSAISAMANRHLIVDHSIHECSARHHYVKSGCE